MKQDRVRQEAQRQQVDRRLKKPLALTTLLVAGAATHQPALADSAEERIAELERQIAELKSMVLNNAERVETNLQTLTVQAEDIESVRPVRKKGTSFKYGGYVQLDAIASRYSEGRPPALMDDLFVPSLIPVELPDGTGDASGSTNIHAKTSRFFFSTNTPTAAGPIRSHIELDFVLSGQGDERVSNSFSSRIRSAYIDWEYEPGQSLLVGQQWSTFFNVSTLPDLIEFVGPVGTIFERQPMIRWTNGPLQIALENQTTRVNLPGGGTRLDDAEYMPDIVARYNGKSGDLSWSMAAIGRTLTFEERLNSNTEVSSDEQFGYGLSFAGKWQMGRDDIRFMASYGDALGRYMGLNAFNDGYIDVNGDIDTIDQWGGFVALRHFWSDKWRSSLSLSASGANNPSMSEFAAAGSLAKAYRSMHVNLNYLPAPGLQIGGELMYGSKELEDGRDGDMYRLQFGAKFAF